MKKEKYIVEIEMPDGDASSSMYIQDVIQSDCDIEDEGRWKVSVKEYWKPSDAQMEALDDFIYAKYPNIEKDGAAVKSLYQDLKKLREE